MSIDYYNSYTQKKLRETSAVKSILSEEVINGIYMNKILTHI